MVEFINFILKVSQMTTKIILTFSTTLSLFFPHLDFYFSYSSTAKLIFYSYVFKQTLAEGYEKYN